MVFDKRQTNIAKGVAIALLLWRHLFELDSSGYDNVKSLFYVFNMPVECLLAKFSMVCVSIFVILSGFGLYKSYKLAYDKCIADESEIKNIIFNLKFIKKHIIKLLMVYFVVFLLSYVTLSIINEKILLDIYQGNVLYFIINLLGLSNVFGTPTIFGTYWYIGMILLFYILFPILMKIEKYSIELLLGVSFILLVFPGEWDFDSVRAWLFPFVFGMFFAKYNVFEMINSLLKTNQKKIINLLIFFIGMAIVRMFIMGDKTTFDAFFGFSILLLCYMVLSKIPVLNAILEHLGRSSAIMFMLHPLIFTLYLNIFKFNYSILTYIILLLLTYLFSNLLMWLMKVTRYNRLIEKFIRI